ncbi:MAG: carbohydrate-binding family 9-like protein [Candidatus Omnitrophota bacterium]
MMLKNKAVFLGISLAVLLVVSRCATSGEYLKSSKFFVRWQEVLIEREEIAVPKEDVIVIQPVDAMLQDPARIMKAINVSGTKFSPFMTHPFGTKPAFGSEADLLFDRNYLYVYLEAEKEPGYRLKATKFDKDTTFAWYDDNFEIFIDPFASRSEYFHFIINSLGYIFDEKCFEKIGIDPAGTSLTDTIACIEHDIEWKAEGTKAWTQSGEKKWSALVRIPFTSFGLQEVSLYSVWGLNLCHTNWFNKELSQWRVTKRNFHQPAGFGNIMFGKQDEETEVSFRAPLIGYGNNVLHLVVNNRGQGKTGKVEVTVTDANGKKISEREQVFQLRPDRKSKEEITYSIPGESGRDIYVTASVSIGNRKIGYFIRRVQLGGLMEFKMGRDVFFTDDIEIPGRIKLDIGERSLDKISLVVEAGSKKKIYCSRIERLGGNLLQFGINTKLLSVGEWYVEVSAMDGNKEIARQRYPITLVAPPEF